MTDWQGGRATDPIQAQDKELDIREKKIHSSDPVINNEDCIFSELTHVYTLLHSEAYFICSICFASTDFYYIIINRVFLFIKKKKSFKRSQYQPRLDSTETQLNALCVVVSEFSN